MTVIATYDITDNGRRSRVAALLQAHGDRIQKSVFLLELAPEAMSTVRDRAREILWLIDGAAKADMLGTRGVPRASGQARTRAVLVSVVTRSIMSCRVPGRGVGVATAAWKTTPG